MGKLVRLEVNNFKSYRGRHTLLFGDAYFTSIIGPNGSGKSNSMDAISFVLGVKSARLRSSNLADLIYRGRIIRTTKINADGTATEANGEANGDTQENGESQRDAAPKSAWVKAVFEDDAEQIHEWQRTVTSSGSSEYRINGRQVTAKDYNDALEEQSILVKARNFLVFQGEVEKVAEKSPKALTEMVEQISGSLEKKADYERLKSESEAASENNAQHLAQRRQINAEIRTYQELKAEADEYEKKLAERDDAVVTHTLWKLFLYQQTMEKARSKIANHQEELQEHKRSVEKFHRKHEETRQAEAKVRREVAKTEKTMKEKERAVEDTSNTLAPIQEKIRLATQDRQKYASRIAELEQKRDNEQRHVEKYQKDIELVRKAEQKWEDDFKAAAQRQGRDLSEQDLQEYNRLRGEVTRQTHANQAQIDRLKREVDTQKEETRNLKQSVDGHKEAIERLNEEINRLKESQRNLETTTKELDRTRATKQQELDRLKSDRRQTQLQIQELNLQFQDRMKEKIAFDSRRQESKKQQQARAALERLRDRFGREKIHGRYRDLFTPKQAKFRQAVGRVFGPQMEYVIVDTDATAKDCISYLRDNKLGIMDFIPLDSVQIKALSPQVKGTHKGMRLAIDCINYEPRYERAMTAACASTMVCDTEAIAKELRFVKKIPAKAVTLDGVVIAKSGAQTGGASHHDRDTGDQGWDEQAYQTILSQLSSYEKELSELAKRDRAYKPEQELEVELNDLREQIRINQEELKALGRNLDSSKRQLDHHKKSLKASQPNYNQNSQRLQNLEEELKNYQEAVDSIADQVFGTFCQRLGYASIRDYEAQQGGIQQEAAEQRLEFKKQRSQLQYVMKQHETMLQSIEERLSSAEEKSTRDDALIAQLESQQDDLQNSLDVFQAELESLQETRAKLDAKLAERIKEVKEARRALDQRNEKVKHVLKEVDDEESKIKISATSRYNVLKQCRVDEIKIPLTADSKPLASLPMTDMPRPDADAMDVDEDPDSTQINQPEVDDYGIEINFGELQDDLKTELLEILEEEDQQDEKLQDQAVAALKEAEGKLTDHVARLDIDISKATPNMRAGERLAAAEAKLQEVDEQFSEARKRAAYAKKAFEDVKQKRLTLFMKAFNHISENIGGTYKDLTKSDQFPLGGQAYLDMEDSTEPYLAGLKYHAMPPLKRFRDMEHLSGGEKTIAALALLFAIHSYQPSPFFVLDEVDAALDNVNVGRVTRYMKEHASPGMQFIVISLKAIFFQESESLVGVMRDQAKMSSKVVSLDLRKYVPA